MPVHPLIRKLQNLIVLADDEAAALEGAFSSPRDVAGDVDLVREGDRPTSCYLILEGFVCRYKLLPDGRRQIMSFHIPGDLCDLPSLFLPTMDHNIGTLAASKVAQVPHETMLRLLETYPRIN